MKVIVAGFPKTGTKSMNAALTMLGYKVYDYFENVVLLEKEYTKIANEGWTTEDFRRMYEDVDAIVDFPAFYFWEEIHKAFPDAKIVLTVRNSEEEWYASFWRHMKLGDSNIFFKLMQHFSPTYRRIGANISDALVAAVFGITSNDKNIQRQANQQKMIMKYRAHNAYVLQNAPKDKLLVFQCTEGWEPLCKFLEQPVPEAPFPRKNVAGSIMKKIFEENPLAMRIARETQIGFGLFVSAVAVSSILIYKIGPSVICRSAVNGITAGLGKVGIKF